MNFMSLTPMPSQSNKSITILPLSKVTDGNDVFRLDAEYFGGTGARAHETLVRIGAQLLSTFATVTDGIHTSIPFEDGGGVKILSAKHPKNNFVDRSAFEEIGAAFHAKNPRTALREGDVLLSTVGTIGNSAVVTADLLPANSDRHIAIIRTGGSDLNPYYLSSFLCCRYGREQSVRESTGNVQLNLFLSKVGKLLIPRFDAAFEKRIAQRAALAYRLRASSLELFQKAEGIISDHLGLDQFEPAPALTYITAASTVFDAGRIDAEHFAPKFDVLEEKLRAAGSCSLQALVHFIQRGTQPDYGPTGVPVVNSKHVLRGQVNVSDDNRTAQPAERSPLIESGDVLINGTGVGTIGRSSAYLRQAPAVPDNHVTVLRVRRDLIDPVYLAAFLNSSAGQHQVDKHLHGSSGQIELYPTDLNRFEIWLAPDSVQREVRRLTERGMRAQELAETLASSCQTMLERRIEAA